MRVPTILGAGALALTLSLTLNSSAEAAIMQAVFTGTITVDFDGTGAELFDLAQPQLLGQIYTMTFQYNTSFGELFESRESTLLQGGPFSNTTSPIILATITVNGITRSIPTTAVGTVDVLDNSFGRVPTECIDSLGTAVSLPDDVQTRQHLGACFEKPGFPFNRDLSTPFEVHGGELFSRGDADLLDTPDGVHVVNEVRFRGSLTDLVVTRLDVGGVPEPSGWALMILGMGSIGATLRRRRETKAA